jgi:methionyl-tRNA synthetase
MKNFYITTTLPYINSDPHLGFAKEIINADIIARHKRQLGFNVFFNTGTDEHGQKIFQKAQENGLEPIHYCDEYAKRFFKLKDVLNLSFNSFVRTTDKKHKIAVQDFWSRCLKNGDIYKKNYQVKYCVGCEMEKTDSELVDGLCPMHPKQKIEMIDEENYFFKFSKYQDDLLKLYKNKKDFVIPVHRQKEISNFVERGLRDFSISRLRDKMPWGVSVPGDDSQVMYVWFDALVNYISCLKWPNEKGLFSDFWPGIQVCGKDNLRPQTAMWPAMLLSAGAEASKSVLVFGFLTMNGEKISKSLGNNIDPVELIGRYGSDVVRYYLVKDIPTFEDGDFSYERLEQTYTSDLSNGLGNLVSRVSNLIEKMNQKIVVEGVKVSEGIPFVDEDTMKNFEPWKRFKESMDKYNLNEALVRASLMIKSEDEFLSQEKPWKIEDENKKGEILRRSANNIMKIALSMYPFIPQSSMKIINAFSADKIVKIEPIFPRI